MMSALECLHKAEHCERMARASADSMDRRMLIETATYWRTLARTAEARSQAGQHSGGASTRR